MWIRSIVVDEMRGLSIQATEWSRRGPTCVLLHGFGDNSSVWSHLAPQIMSRFRVITIDLRGHGNSDWDPETRYDTETLTADLAAIIGSFGLERTILIGHSWGAGIASRFAAAQPAVVAGLVIVDFGPELSEAGVAEILRGFTETPSSFGSSDEYARWLAARRPFANPRMLEQYARYGLRQSTDGRYQIKNDSALGTKAEIARLTPENGHYHIAGLWTALESIKCRTLVVRGGASGVFPRNIAARMVERMPAGELQSISGAGHAVMMDNPVQFTARVAEFLEDCPR
jgi:pimeloyl-ACP methyl ester carboxylesterase